MNNIERANMTYSSNAPNNCAIYYFKYSNNINTSLFTQSGNIKIDKIYACLFLLLETNHSAFSLRFAELIDPISAPNPNYTHQ